MPLLPYQKFTIRTFRKKGEVMQSLTDNVEIRANDTTLLDILTGTLDVPFYGALTNDAFSITRKSTTRNLYKPILHGHCEDQSHTTIIHVEAHLDIISMVLFGLVAVLLFGTLVVSAFSDDDIFLTIGSAISLFIGYGLLVAAFNFELWRAKKRLLNIVKGDIIS